MLKWELFCIKQELPSKVSNRYLAIGESEWLWGRWVGYGKRRFILALLFTGVSGKMGACLCDESSAYCYLVPKASHPEEAAVIAAPFHR